MCDRFVQSRSVTELAACSAHPSPRICLHHATTSPPARRFWRYARIASACAAPLRAHHQLRQGSRHWPPPSNAHAKTVAKPLSPKSLLDPTGWLLRLAVDSKRQIAIVLHPPRRAQPLVLDGFWEHRTDPVNVLVGFSHQSTDSALITPSTESIVHPGDAGRDSRWSWAWAKSSYPAKGSDALQVGGGERVRSVPDRSTERPGHDGLRA